MTSLSYGTTIMLTGMIISFYSINRKTESLFFVCCSFLIYFGIEKYLGKDGYLNFLALIFVIFSFITFIRFVMQSKYDKILF